MKYEMMALLHEMMEWPNEKKMVLQQKQYYSLDANNADSEERILTFWYQ